MSKLIQCANVLINQQISIVTRKINERYFQKTMILEGLFTKNYNMQ